MAYKKYNFRSFRYGTNQQAPCKDCQRRFAGCHSKCLEYIDYKQKVEVQREQNIKHSDIDKQFIAMRQEGKKKYKNK